MNSNINSAMSIKEWSMLLALSFLWGGSFFFVEIAITQFPPLTVVASRVALASIALWLFVFATGLKIPKAPKVWLSFLVMGILNNVVPFTLIVWGQTHIASGLASILNATTPIFTIIVATVLLVDERLTYSKALGVLLGFIGAVIMIGQPALAGQEADLLAQIAILSAALSYALAGVYGRRYKEMKVSPVITAAGQVSASSIVLVPIVLIIDQPFSLPFPTVHISISILALAVLSTAVAYILYFRILASAGATNLLLVTFLIPVSAIILGTAFLGESLEPFQLFGMGFIGIGLFAIDGRFWRVIHRYIHTALNRRA